jgi:hypothetical protein
MKLVGEGKPPGGDGVREERHQAHILVEKDIGGAVDEAVGYLGIAGRGLERAQLFDDVKGRDKRVVTGCTNVIEAKEVD